MLSVAIILLIFFTGGSLLRKMKRFTTSVSVRVAMAGLGTRCEKLAGKVEPTFLQQILHLKPDLLSSLYFLISHYAKNISYCDRLWCTASL